MFQAVSRARLTIIVGRYNLIFSYAGVAELADAQDLGSCVNSCRFKSCHPHQNHKDGKSRPYGFGENGFVNRMGKYMWVNFVLIAHGKLGFSGVFAMLALITFVGTGVLCQEQDCKPTDKSKFKAQTGEACSLKHSSPV